MRFSQNTAPITINTSPTTASAPTTASPYPSTINVSGTIGGISSLKVTLNNLSHTRTQDVDILLVSPNGMAVLILSDGGIGGASNVNLTFDDAASLTVAASPIVSGTYKPSNITASDADVFENPAPLRPFYETQGDNLLRRFNNFSPNGVWSLFVVDDQGGESGTIAGGWSLDITTAPIATTNLGCNSPVFAPAANYAVNSNPTNLANADFNGDGKPDLVMVNNFSNDVSILLNNGAGGFGAATNIAVGSSPYAVVTEKFNADNNFDIAVTNSGSNNISILLGNGNGTFTAPINVLVGSQPISIAAGDFNNDSITDLAVANFGGFFIGTISILRGNGNGTFAAPINLRSRTQPSFVLAANLDADANLDLAVANFGADSVTVFRGSGSGTFAESSTVSLNNANTLGQGPVSIAAADRDGDGDLDLVTANYNSNNLSTLNNNGAGVFNLSFNQSSANNPIAIAAADILNRGGGNSQLIVARSSTNKIAFNSFDITVGDFPNGLTITDFDNDGRVDTASANSGSNNVSVLLNRCASYAGNLFDFNGDRRTDFGYFRPNQARWFTTGAVTDFGTSTDRIVPADYNGDGLTDIAYYRPSSGLWHVARLYFIGFGLPTDIPAPADFDGDGKADIAVYRPSAGNWFIRTSKDNGFLSIQFGADGDQPVAADYDGDGKADVAVFRPSTGGWYWLNSSNGQFRAVQWGTSGDKVVPADFDNDGSADLTVYRNGTWFIYQSSNGGYRTVAFGLSSDIPTPGDYDGDGKVDVAVFRPSNGTWYYESSIDGRLVGVQSGQNGDIPIPSAYVR